MNVPEKGEQSVVTIDAINDYGFSIPLSSALVDGKERVSSLLNEEYLHDFLEKVTHHASILYMVYWYHRTRDEGKRKDMFINLQEYIYNNTSTDNTLLLRLLQDQAIPDIAKRYVENELIPQKTVDIVIVRGDNEDKEILIADRVIYPKGSALPGGFILDMDESNDFNMPGYIYATLRVAGEKILERKNLQYGINNEERFYFVRNSDRNEIRVYFRNANGHKFSDHLKYMTTPSDPRHMVDTIGMQCEIVGDIGEENLFWKKKSEIMDPQMQKGGFVLMHHRDIVAHLSARNGALSLEYEQHHAWVRSLINHPEEEYTKMKDQFLATDNNINTSFPILAPVIKKVLDNLFSPEINKLCSDDTTLNGLRDKTVISIRHCLVGNRNFCPYLPTLEAIMKGITFFDVAARVKKEFYHDFPSDTIYEHNPREKAYASYHMYRYEYRWNEIKGMLPHEIIIPTFEPLGATDLMKLRGIPVWLVGLSSDFTYVDEFEQSPEEFFMHDVNHSYRMIEENEKYKQEKMLTKEEFIANSNNFIRSYFSDIKILPSDSDAEKEIKKLKKIILFEIVHEDARVFTRESIIEALQVKEGGNVGFEVPHINPEKLIEVVDTIDHGISPLSYVRNKLQHGFYDKIDTQITQIVHPKYRTSDWIAKAAYSMLRELKATANDGVRCDEAGNISYEWLLERTCSVGPDNIHQSPVSDPIFESFNDGNISVNPKRYQA